MIEFTHSIFAKIHKNVKHIGFQSSRNRKEGFHDKQEILQNRINEFKHRLIMLNKNKLYGAHVTPKQCISIYVYNITNVRLFILLIAYVDSVFEACKRSVLTFTATDRKLLTETMVK